MNAGLERLEDLGNWEVDDLLRVKNLGKVTLGEIICIAKREGIELKGMDKEVYKEKDDKKITTEGVLEEGLEGMK
jgi:DNA-directed RNA polymerase alpha subunit